MKAYELLYFVDPAATEEIRASVSKRIEGAVVTPGGVVDNVEDWGKRKLAYDPTQIAELDRVLRINDNVKRHMIVRRPDKD